MTLAYLPLIVQYLCDLREAMSLLTSYFPHPFTKCYGYERAFFTLRRFLSYTPCCIFQGSSGSRQFNLKISRASYWSSNLVPAYLFAWITPIYKGFIRGKLHLRVRAGQSRNINLYGELTLQNVSFEISASHGIWTLFTDKQTC